VHNRQSIKEPASWNPSKTKFPDGWDTGAGGHGSFHRQGREKGQKVDKQRGHSRRHAGFNERWDAMERSEQCGGTRNKRSVWNIAPKPFKEAHFATFPPDLVIPRMSAGSPANGIVLDPFAGSGTVGLVANNLNRHAILFELNPAYIEIAKRRCGL
jgi:DNA modification methylase